MCQHPISRPFHLLPLGQLNPAPYIDMLGDTVLASEAVTTLLNFGSGGASYDGARTSGSVFIRRNTAVTTQQHYLDFSGAAVKVGGFPTEWALMG